MFFLLNSTYERQQLDAGEGILRGIAEVAALELDGLVLNLLRGHTWQGLLIFSHVETGFASFL